MKGQSIFERIAIATLLVFGLVLCTGAWSGVYRIGRANAHEPVHVEPLVYRGAPAQPSVAEQMPYLDGHAMRELGDQLGKFAEVNASPRMDPLFFQSVPNILEQPGESVDLLTRLWRDGQIANLTIVVAFLALTVASRKVPWFSEGHRAVYAAAAIAGLSMLAESASRGTTPNASMLVGAALAALTLVINAKAPAQVAAGLPVARALKSPHAFYGAGDEQARARRMHAAFTASMGTPQAWHNLSAEHQEHWLAAAREGY